ncbi:hypothetical protein OUZ56_013754 [Daphnia magna]|uniref:Uncharacterized protein n=1 Tax=Daphnia magna TaxID=35525 RepID=A0ABQ9Z7K2_9CRUS|nr:hypothetical protein OUZ56_013754 [Daphnia magna]
MMYIPIELYSSSEYETADVYTMSQQQDLIKAIHVNSIVLNLSNRTATGHNTSLDAVIRVKSQLYNRIITGLLLKFFSRDGSI